MLKTAPLCTFPDAVKRLHLLACLDEVTDIPDLRANLIRGAGPRLSIGVSTHLYGNLGEYFRTISVRAPAGYYKLLIFMALPTRFELVLQP